MGTESYMGADYGQRPGSVYAIKVIDNGDGTLWWQDVVLYTVQAMSEDLRQKMVATGRARIVPHMDNGLEVEYGDPVLIHEVPIGEPEIIKEEDLGE